MSEKDLLTVNHLLSWFTGKSLVQLCVGVGDLQLNFDDLSGGCGQIQIESPIAFGAATGEVETLEPSGIDALRHLLPRLNQEAVGAIVRPESTLVLSLPGVTLEIAADPKYEAWSFGVANPDSRVVCTGGGRLDILASGRDEA